MDLKDTLFIGKVDDSELSSILLLHFGFATSGLSNQVHFSRRGGVGSVTLTYRSGEIIGAEGAQLMPDEVAMLVEKIKRDLVESPGTAVARRVLLSSYRVTGSFAWGDRLRILPVPQHAPHAPNLTENEYYSQHLTVEHPFLIEFPIARSKNSFVEIERLERETRKYALLLNVLLEGHVATSSRGGQRHWVHENGADLSDGYRYLSEGYRYVGLVDIGPGFSPLEGIPPMGTMEYYDFFGNPRQDLNPPMRVATFLPILLERFAGMSKSDQQRFMRSAFWFHHAASVWRTSNSAAYLAIISSIETLRPSVPPTDRCDRCGAPRGKGAARQFAEFLNTVAPPMSGDHEVRRELYRLRSALIHGGDLFHSDLEALTRMHPKSTAESHSYFVATGLARRALLYWLTERTGGWPISQ